MVYLKILWYQLSNLKKWNLPDDSFKTPDADCLTADKRHHSGFEGKDLIASPGDQLLQLTALAERRKSKNEQKITCLAPCFFMTSLLLFLLPLLKQPGQSFGAM